MLQGILPTLHMLSQARRSKILFYRATEGKLAFHHKSEGDHQQPRRSIYHTAKT